MSGSYGKETDVVPDARALTGDEIAEREIVWGFLLEPLLPQEGYPVQFAVLLFIIVYDNGIIIGRCRGVEGCAAVRFEGCRS